VTQLLDGYWLPQEIKQKFITPETPWVIQHYRAGRPIEGNVPGAVGARWPVFSQSQWAELLSSLHEQRRSPPEDYMDRLEAALVEISQRFNDPNDPLTKTALSAIPTYTGYSAEMIQFVLGALDLMPLSTLREIIDLDLPTEIQEQYLSFQELGNLTGRIKFYRERSKKTLNWGMSIIGKKSFSISEHYPNQVLGYAAGNVIGTAHLISMLGQVSALIRQKTTSQTRKYPAILVKNSRQEPIFAPLIFSALEEIDAQLTNTIAIMIWDYSDASLQEYLISQSDLVIAAAADITIDQIEEVIQRVQSPSHQIRFHPHGHKVSFTTIGKAYLDKKAHVLEGDSFEIIHLTTTLAAVDSIFWDQYGCLSSRVHFIEHVNNEHAYSPSEYAHILAEKIRMMSSFIPRGSIPLQGLHTRFEKYIALSSSGEIELCSTYEDDFLVIVDHRPWSPSIFMDVVNDCIERTIIVRPVEDIQQVPDTYLGWIPANNLQTMSVAIDGREHQSWSSEFSLFVDAIGKRGVTGIRTIGRGPFPQLAYSWDGFLPLDLSLERPPGRFTTVEFDNTFLQILDTFKLYSAKSGLAL